MAKKRRGAIYMYMYVCTVLHCAALCCTVPSLLVFKEVFVCTLRFGGPGELHRLAIEAGAFPRVLASCLVIDTPA